jgi:hypothetical protein
MVEKNISLSKLIDLINKELDQLNEDELDELKESFELYGIEHTLNVDSPLPESKVFTFLNLFSEGLESLYATVMNKKVSF